MTPSPVPPPDDAQRFFAGATINLIPVDEPTVTSSSSMRSQAEVAELRQALQFLPKRAQGPVLALCSTVHVLPVLEICFEQNLSADEAFTIGAVQEFTPASLMLYRPELTLIF